MAVMSRLLDSSGNVVSEKDWYYNPSDFSGISSLSEYMYFSGTPAFCSHGYVKVWNGNGYWTYNTFESPYLNDYTA